MIARIDAQVLAEQVAWGALVVRDKDTRDKLIRYPGLAVYRLDTGQLEIVQSNGEFPDDHVVGA